LSNNLSSPKITFRVKRYFLLLLV